MNIKNYLIVLNVFFVLLINAMDVAENNQDLADNIIEFNPTTSIQITSSEDISIPTGPLIGGFKKSRGGAKETPQTFVDMRSLVRERSVASARTRRPQTQVPPLNIPPKKTVPISLVEKEQPQQFYTLEQVQALLNQQAAVNHPLVSERLLELGQKKNVPIDRLHQHAYLFDEINVTPRMLAEAIYRIAGEEDKQPEKFEVKDYEKILKNRPEKYEELVFDIFEALMGDDPGSAASSLVPSKVVNTHAGILKREVETQQTNLFHAKILIVVKFLVILGTGAWAIYGQASSGCPAVLNGTAV
jgi:hypothetical protein